MPENKCAESCQLTARVEALERANEQHGNTHREIFARLNDVERDNAVQDAHYRQIIDKLDDLTRRHDELNRKLSELEAKPGRRWDKLIEVVIACLVTGVVAFLLGRIGL